MKWTKCLKFFIWLHIILSLPIYTCLIMEGNSDQSPSILSLSKQVVDEQTWCKDMEAPQALCLLYLVFSHSIVSDSLWPHGLQHARLPCPSLSPGSLLKFMSVEFIELVMLSNYLILCHPLLLLPSIFPSIRVFSRVGSWHQVVKVLELQLKHKSFQ